jgi:hypothetical protein
MACQAVSAQLFRRSGGPRPRPAFILRLAAPNTSRAPAPPATQSIEAAAPSRPRTRTDRCTAQIPCSIDSRSIKQFVALAPRTRPHPPPHTSQHQLLHPHHHPDGPSLTCESAASATSGSLAVWPTSAEPCTQGGWGGGGVCGVGWRALRCPARQSVGFLRARRAHCRPARRISCALRHPPPGPFRAATEHVAAAARGHPPRRTPRRPPRTGTGCCRRWRTPAGPARPVAA